jgi:spermidine/putrescine transport system ATP-binding protein
MRNELRAIQQRVGITFIYITHDQGEALTMSDRIAVMNAGVIEQVGDGKSVYDNPQTSFVASFVGENNPFSGKVVSADATGCIIETAHGPLQGRNPKDLKQGDYAILFIRPEALSLGNAGANKSLQVKINTVAFEGNMTHVYLQGATSKDIVMTIGRQQDFNLAAGATANLTYDPAMAVALPDGVLASE